MTLTAGSITRMDRLGNHLQIVRLSITLLGMEPKVTRRMDILANTPLDDLHCYIQAAMGWDDYHFWGFDATRYKQRAVWTPADDNFNGSPGLASDATVLDVIDFLDGKPEFMYTYDYGDSWQHKIRIGKIQPALKDRLYPYLVSGSGRCPPEDIGGSWGYADFLDAFDNPDSSYREYYPAYFDGSSIWDPEDAGLDQRRADLERLRQFFSSESEST